MRRSTIVLAIILFVSKCALAAEVQTQSAPCSKKKSYPVHLTFDDGPSAELTPKILDVLKKNNIKATFFILTSRFKSLAKGEKATDKEQQLLEIINRIKREGHTIGFHSYDHMLHADVDQVPKEKALDNLIKNQKVGSGLGLTGKVPFRFPYGSGWFLENDERKQKQAKWAMNYIKAANYEPVHWDIDSWDWSKIKRKALPISVLKQICSHEGGIVLMHDIQSFTANNLESIISSIKSSGHKLVSLNEIKEASSRMPKDKSYLSLADSTAGIFSCNRPKGDFDVIWRDCDEYSSRSTDIEGNTESTGVK